MGRYPAVDVGDAWRSHGALRPRGSLGFGVLGCCLAALYGLEISPTINAVCLGVVAVGSCVALAVGPSLHHPRSVRPWHMLACAAVLFVVGALTRPYSADQTDWRRIITHAFTVAGYLIAITGLGMMLRSRGSLERHALSDGLIVCLGAALVLSVLFALPAARVAGQPTWLSALLALYPMFDLVLLLVLLNLAFTTAAHLPSYRAITIGMVALFAGDLGYAWIGARGQQTGPALLDLPFLIAYTCYGVAALHPSMAEMSSVVATPVQAWSLGRLSLILPALAAPAVILMAVPHMGYAERVAVAVVAPAMVATLLVRAVSAVRGYARVQEVFRHQALHDALTGLPNRVHLSERVEALLAARRRDDPPVWLLFLDLDGFKFVNDSWGHETGDRLLVEVAQRLSSLAGPSDTVARIGGDEFVVATQRARDGAVDLAELVQAALREPIEVIGLELVVTVSIGMAEATTRGAAEALLRDADTAMYRAKGDGRDRWMVFDSSMRQSVRDRVEIELPLRHAVPRGQLWIAYQPIVDLYTERTVGAEFIPVAEETGMITEIGAWVLTESLRQLARWQEQGLVPQDFSMSVNASTRQLRDHRLRDVIAAVLAETGLAPSQLTVEITESVMMEHSEAVSAVLLDLRSLGLRLSVDDFGTGYSSLGYLSRFPVTGVKVDRAFVDGLGDDPGDEAIVRAVAAMAGALDLAVVAEGVETTEQRDILGRIGVEQAQGRLWGRPVDGEAFAASYGAARVQAGVGNSYAQ
jgi:diguanylate cyclase